MTVQTKKQLNTTELLKNRQSEWLLYGLVFGVWIIWNILSVHNNASRVSQIKVSDTALTIIRISVIVPYLLTWEAAMHAIIRLRRYAKAIGSNEESQGFTYFFKGMTILLIGLMLTSLVPTLKGVLHTQGRSTQALTIITNYAYVVPYLLAFWCFFLGARKLSYRLREKNSSFTYVYYGALLTIFAYIWLDLIFTNSSRTVSMNPAIPATYYLRDSLIILTIVLPSFIAWILGFLGVLELKRYGAQVKGILYRSALRSFVKGVGGVIIGSVLLQGLLSLGTARLIQLGLDKLLIIIYMFLIIQGLGFFFIAQGSRRLTKIESV